MASLLGLGNVLSEQIWLASWFAAGPGPGAHVREDIVVGQKLYKARRLSVYKNRFASQCL